MVTDGFLVAFCFGLQFQMSILLPKTRFSSHFPQNFQVFFQDFRCKVNLDPKILVQGLLRLSRALGNPEISGFRALGVRFVVNLPICS